MKSIFPVRDVDIVAFRIFTEVVGAADLALGITERNAGDGLEW